MIDAALLEEAKCYLCLGVSLPEALKMALLARIAAAEGGGGESCFQCSSGDGAPAAPPAVTTQPASYEDTTNDFTYNWDVPTQQWVPSPKVYRALLTQTGTDAPVATVLENTLGGAVVWSRTTDGIYAGTLAGAFPVASTMATMITFTSDDPSVSLSVFAINANTGNDINIASYSVPTDPAGPGTNVDNLLVNNPVTILVYP